MSLINKMLQDLDARGAQRATPMQSEVKPVARSERNVPLPLVIGGVAGAAVLAVAGVFGWRWWQRPPAPVAAPVAAPLAIVLPQPVAPAISAAPPVAVAPAPAPVASEPPVPKANIDRAPAVRSAEKKTTAPLVRAAPAVRSVPSADLPQPQPRPNRQPSEDEYRRALANLQDGRVSEATAQLEQALRLDPKHEAARQTLVGLLIENRRADEAVKVLQAGLALDARQPALAMLLARLQIEGGGSGVETLQRSLASAGGNADYHAFLAGALQRDQRHREAAEQYVAALRAAPENGVWLMGLGISLLADQRKAEALDAFQRAKASGTLSGELLAFVERKIASM